MLQEDIEKLGRYEFRPAINNTEDFEIYLKIKSDSEAIKYSGFKEAPDRAKFLLYYSKLLLNKNQHLLFLMDKVNDNKVCATFHYQDIDNNTVEGLGYNVFPEYRGRGLGWVMMEKVNMFCRALGYKYRLSKVAETNVASIKNLEKSGAKFTGKIEYRDLLALNRVEKYLIYIKEL